MAHNGLQMHLQCGPSDIAPAVPLPGDPGRAALAAP
jgi:uridine phosphorylase